MNTFILQLIILLFPGFIWLKIEEVSTRTGGWSNYEKILRAFFYGLVSYLTIFGLYELCDQEFTRINMDTANGEIINLKHLDEIIFSILTSVIISVLWCTAKNKKYFIRTLQWLNVTNKFGDEDLWDYIFESPDAFSEYVHVRDFENQLVYSGWVKSFSDDNILRELILRDVITYDFDGNIMFETPVMYLSRPRENINIEFPYAEEEK
jgi:hypothetical protein